MIQYINMLLKKLFFAVYQTCHVWLANREQEFYTTALNIYPYAIFLYDTI